MNLNKIIKQLRGDHPFVVIALGGYVYGFQNKPKPQAQTWGDQGKSGVYLATLAGTFTNWRELLWDFSKDQPEVHALPDCKVLVSLGVKPHPHFKLIKYVEQNPDARVLVRSKVKYAPWVICHLAPTWDEGLDYMIDTSRKVQMGGTVNFQTGLTEIPESTTVVFFSTIAAVGKAASINFDPNSAGHQCMLKNGILHLTKENAVLMTEALYTITQVK